ncbi:hypothetical protein L1049_014951 [Liquidambar formosana]|uniref:ATPase AAA-type core domain-containing protein n=1 Tax=Liquidambar formosana TaxID=63359 RepID=A0AAP0X1H2_LIQFO
MGGSNNWESVILDHPATFDTLAMDMEMKRRIIDDLEKFVKRKEFYRRVGKAWKRGYFVVWASWRLMISTANRSILVVEDIDRSIELEDRRRAARTMGNPIGIA